MDSCGGNKAALPMNSSMVAAGSQPDLTPLATSAAAMPATSAGTQGLTLCSHISAQPDSVLSPLKPHPTHPTKKGLKVQPKGGLVSTLQLNLTPFCHH